MGRISLCISSRNQRIRRQVPKETNIYYIPGFEEYIILKIIRKDSILRQRNEKYLQKLKSFLISNKEFKIIQSSEFLKHIYGHIYLI